MFKKFQRNYFVSEQELYKRNGDCNSFIGEVKLLIITDTHGELMEDVLSEYVQRIGTYDACILLGDHYDGDINIVKSIIPMEKLYGLLGNHDYDYTKRYGIHDINGEIIDINGVKILGMQGSSKYKNTEFPSFTQKESIEFFKHKESVDILVSHDNRFDYTRDEFDAHRGLIGITKYLYEKRVPIHIHGHIHKKYNSTLLNGTREFSLYGVELISFS